MRHRRGKTDTEPAPRPFMLGERLTFQSELIGGPVLVVQVIELNPGDLAWGHADRASWSVHRDGEP